MDNKKAILYWNSSEIEEDDYWSWEDFIMELQNLLDKKNKDIYWKAIVKNFGWRNQDGYKYFKSTTATDFLQQILPNTDCTFYIFNYRNGLAIRNYHHDSPTGNEVYYITPIKEETYEKNN